MFPGLTPFEASMIRRDWEGMLESPEACKVKLEYNTFLIPGQQNIDPVYKTNKSPYGPKVALDCISCIIQIVNDRNLKILGFGIVEVGDAILYFSDSFNIGEPIQGQKPVPETLHFTDPLGNQWTPVLKDTGPLKRYLGMELGNQAIAQVVPCTLRKG